VRRSNESGFSGFRIHVLFTHLTDEERIRPMTANHVLTGVVFTFLMALVVGLV